MSERDHYPPGVLCWVDTAPPEPEKALDFYGAVLGWDFIGSGSMPADGSSDRRRGADLCRSSNRAALTAASEVPATPTTRHSRSGSSVCSFASVSASLAGEA
jgi:hypothetical protein